MRLLLQSLMIFFGTLLAAALLVLGEPSGGQGSGARHGDAFGAAAQPQLEHVMWQDHAAAAQAAR